MSKERERERELERELEAIRARVIELERERSALTTGLRLTVGVGAGSTRVGTEPSRVGAGPPGAGGLPASFHGLEEMLLLVGADQRVGYLNGPMARLLGVTDRRAALGAPIDPLDHGPLGEGTLAALCSAARAVEGGVEWEQTFPELPPERLPVTGRFEGSVAPRLRVHARSSEGRVQILLQDVTRLRWIEDAFARFVSPHVIETVLTRAGSDLLRMARREVSMVYADLRGFTRLVQTQPLEEIQEMLAAWFGEMQSCVEEAGGLVTQLVGDQVVALFGAPVARADHALGALLSARDMQRRHVVLRRGWRERGWVAPALGVGVSTGQVAVGTLGTEQMMYYTALGYDMNLGARLCAAAGPGEVLTVPATHAAAREALSRETLSRDASKGDVSRGDASKGDASRGEPQRESIPRLRFSPLGVRRFKNCLEPTEVLRLEWDGAKRRE